MASVILILGAITIAFLTHKLFPLIIPSKQQPRGTKQPPGPPGIPLLGNLLQIQPIHSWLQFKEWADKYGPIYRFSIAGRENIVVSTEKIANDLLRERGTLYSGREHLVMAGDLLSDNLRPLLLSYTDLWRRGRKLMHAVTMTSMADSYQPVQSHESKRLLYDLLQDPKRYEFWFERYSSAIIFRIGYGMKVETGEEAFIKRALGVVHTVERVASPGSYLVDTFPILKCLPEILAPFKKEGRLLHAEELYLFRGLLQQVRKQLKLGSAPPSMMKTFLEQQQKFDLSDDEGAYVIGTLFEAGSGTTAAAMMSYVFAMTHYPEWQREMWKELDEVVGGRMPEFDDILQLPVCRAVIKEVLRWRPVTAGGVPHQLVKDDFYDGFFFPAGTNVHANQWAIHREEALYPDPENFNPARWLRPEYPTYKEPLTKFPTLQNYSSFGFGRRICPGMNIAERSLYILTARLAWACEISKRKDREGKEIEVPWYDYTSGFNVQPKPFEFVLKPRSIDIERVVGEAWENVREHDSLV